MTTYFPGFVGGGTDDTYDGTGAVDTVAFTTQHTTVNAEGGANTITGTSGNNVIVADDGADKITEPPPVCRRLITSSHATISNALNCA